MRLLREAFGWLADAHNWTGTVGLGARLGEHVWYSVIAVLLASLIAIPAGWYIGHSGHGRGLIVGLTGAARALPTLGLVTLLGILLGVGLLGPMIAFVVLAIPSILAGAYAGIDAIETATRDAARANGMTEWQLLWLVEMPLGLPLLVSGIRSATLQVVSTATLAAYVGAGGLGRVLFRGLKTQDYPQMLASSILVVCLAIAFEFGFALLRQLLAPAHLKDRHR